MAVHHILSITDLTRQEVDALFESRGGAFLKDPWAARDKYIDVVLDRTPERFQAWLSRHARTSLDDAGRVEVAQLMEMERQRMLMYTSCGWFFDDLAGLEPVQNLKYAALALRYFRQLGGGAPETELLRRLEAAPADGSPDGDGAGVYRRLVLPAVVDPERVVAELSSLATTGAIPPRVFELIDEARGLGFTLDLVSARDAMRGAVHESLVALQADASPDRIAAALALIEGAGRAGIRFGLWSAQNDFFAVWRARPDARPALQPLASALGFALPAEPRA